MFDRQSIKWVTGLLIFLSMAWTLTLSAQSQIANPEREAKLKLRDERRAMAQKAQKSGNFATAIKAGEATLEIESELFGTDHSELISTIDFLAGCEEAQEKWDAALMRREDVLARTIKEFGEADYRVADARQALKHLSILKNLTRLQIQSLREATLAETQMAQLFRERKFAAGLELAQANLELRVTILGREHPTIAMSLRNMAEWHNALGNYAAAEPLYQQAVNVWEIGLGPNHPGTAMSLSSLAEFYNSRGNYAAAEPLFQRALKITDKSLGPEHPETAKRLNNLAELYRLQAKYAAADPLYQRALKIWEKALGPNDSETAACLNNLGLLYYTQANYAAAEPIYQRALKIREKALGPDHLATATSLNNLAELYRIQAKYAEAESLYLRALKIKETSLGPDHLATAISLNNLANLYASLSNYAAAEPMFRRALRIKEKSIGPDHPDTGRSLNTLAEVYLAQSNFAAAEPLLLRALKIREKALGPEHPDMAISLNSLATMYYSQSNFAAAEPFFQRALNIREKSLGPDHSHTAISLSNLAQLYQVQSNYVAAEPLLLRALKIREKALGPDHPDTAMNQGNLATLYKSQGNFTAAEPLYRRALTITENTLGPDHPDTAINLNNLAELYRVQSNDTAAESLYQRALKIWESTLGPDHPFTAQCLNNLALLYSSQSNYAAAEPLYQRAVKIKEKVLGPEHPETILSLNNQAMLFWDQQRDVEARQLVSRTTSHTIAQLEQTAAIQSEAQQFLMTNEKRRDIDLYLTFHETDNATAKETWGTLLNWKGLITTRQTQLRQVLKKEPEYIALQTVTQQLSRHVLNPPLPSNDPKLIAAWIETAPVLRQAWQDKRARLETEYERIEKELSQKSALFRTTHQQKQVTVDDLQQLLDSQASPTVLVDLVEYRYRARNKEPFERRIAAFVISGDGTVTRVELGSAKEIAELIQVWRSTFGRDDKGQQSAERLRERLWQPLTPALAGARLAVISPDGVLGEFPWNALPGAKPGSFLLEEISLAFIPVPQMLPQLLQATTTNEPPTSLLLVGEISYGADAGKPGNALSMRAMRDGRDGKVMQFPPLPAAQAELSSIRMRYEDAFPKGDAKRLRHSEATEAAFRAQAVNHPWLHVVTHGYFVPEIDLGPAPQFVGIGASLKVEDGKLRVIQVVAGGTAANDGRLQAGDEIVAVSNSDNNWIVMSGKTIDEAVGVIRGPVGTEISLQVRPKDKEGEPVKYTLTRAAISVPPAKVEAVHPGLLSGLAFAGANTPPEEGKDDGILTALEVSALDLSQVDTVVLSACETGLGQVAGGEGLLGLQRAFQVAGAKTTVASLWKVPDRATATLMQRFYENLCDKKMGKLEALREAQIWMLRDNGNRGLAIPDHPPDAQALPPYYWAAFVLSGDWR